MIKAFSLIELMVVIAIVAILSAIAVPSYKDYTTKVRITNAYSVIKNLEKELLATYNSTGSFPSSITWQGITIADGSPTIDVSATSLAQELGIQGISYARGGGNGDNAQGIYLQTYLIPTAVGLPPIADPNGYSIKQGVLTTSGVTQSYCGFWDVADNGVNDIPAEYQPASCNCTLLGNIALSDTAPVCN